MIYDYIVSENLGTLFTMVACGLCVSKMVDRIAKFYIVALQGAFFFALLDTFRRLATAIVAVLVFGEALGASKIVALMLSILAIFLHSYSDRRQKILKAQAALYGSFLQPPTYEEEQERLRERYATARGLSETATWEDIEEHDAETRKGTGISRVSLAAATPSGTEDGVGDPGGAGAGGGGGGMGEGLLGDVGGPAGGGSTSEAQTMWDFLGLDFLLEAGSDVRALRGATAEDVDVVAATGSRPHQAGSALGGATLGTLGRMTRSGLTAEEDLDAAFDVAYNNYN